MSQGDQTIANQNGASFRNDLNSELQALVSNSSGATAPSTTYAYQWWADTANSLLKQRNAANSGWLVRANLAEAFVLSYSSNVIMTPADFGKTIAAIASFTQTFQAAATLGDGWFIDYKVVAGQTVVFDPNGTEQIDGATTKTVIGPAAGRIICNGSGFYSIGLEQDTCLIPFSTGGTAIADGTTNFLSTWKSTTEAEVVFRVPYSGVLRNFHGYANGVAAGTRTWTLRKNAADTSVTASESSTTSVCSDTSNSVSVAQGDKIAMKLVLSGGSTTCHCSGSIQLVRNA